MIYMLLLGGSKFRSDFDVLSEFKGVIDDRLERIYYWLRKNQMYTFRVKFIGDNNYYMAARQAEASFPVFSDNGILDDDFKIILKCKKENDNR